MPCAAVHLAFYLWYGTPAVDGRWLHWDHATLPHWTAAMNERFPPNIPHTPPDWPHSPYYPSRGLYSSGDNATQGTDARDRRRGDRLRHALMVGSFGHRAAARLSGREHRPPRPACAGCGGGGRCLRIVAPGTVRWTHGADGAGRLRYLHERYGSHPAGARGREGSLWSSCTTCQWSMRAGAQRSERACGSGRS